MTINLLLKNDQIVRLRPHFSFYLALLIIIFSGNLSFAQDLGACQEIPCSAAVLEIIPEFQNVDVSCSQTSTCSSADPARQMIYKVYLNYNIPNPPNHLPFSLDYSSIDIVINLKKVQPSTGGFSRIVEKASKLCSAQLNQWSNSELTVNGDQISFSMEDPVVGNCPDDEIIFEPQQGGGWRAYLFSIVVDAYPGETFYLECSAMTIHSDNGDCVYPPGSNNSQNLITPLATPQVTVNLPSPNIANQNLQVHSPTPVANNNGAVFSVMLKNTNVFQTNVSIEYTEFVVDLILSTAMAAPPLEGVQFSLKFNTDFLELVSPSQGDIAGYGPDNFGLSKVSEGIINTLWFYNADDPDNTIQSGNILFNLTFKIKQVLPDQGELISLNTSTDNLSWDTSDAIYQVVSSATPENMLREVENINQAGAAFKANVSPNPTDGKVILTLAGKEPQDMTFGIFGPYGQMILVDNLKFTGTKQDFAYDELQNLPPGVFIWKLWNKNSNFSGVIVKN